MNQRELLDRLYDISRKLKQAVYVDEDENGKMKADYSTVREATDAVEMLMLDVSLKSVG